jgi:hypothetical protein
MLLGYDWQQVERIVSSLGSRKGGSRIGVIGSIRESEEWKADVLSILTLLSIRCIYFSTSSV